MTPRLAAVNALAAVVETASGLTVWRNLDYAIEDRNTPAAVVVSNREERDPTLSSMSAAGFAAVIDVVLLVANSADPEAAADAIEEVVHAALVADRTLGGTVLDIVRLGGDFDFDLGDACLRTLTYQLKYRG